MTMHDRRWPLSKGPITIKDVPELLKILNEGHTRGLNLLPTGIPGTSFWTAQVWDVYVKHNDEPFAFSFNASIITNDKGQRTGIIMRNTTLFKGVDDIFTHMNIVDCQFTNGKYVFQSMGVLQSWNMDSDHKNRLDIELYGPFNTKEKIE